jgi:hypothetical protein
MIGWLWAFAACACAAGGCGGARQCTSRPEPGCQLDTSELRRALEARVAAAPREPVNVLVLSGGGSYGAWGAGVLKGWRESASAARPSFQVVTGISTGALLASHAFLGTPDDDATLESVYTSVRTSDVYRRKPLLCALFSDSLMDSSPLERLIARQVTHDILDRVAGEAQRNRRLYVGTTNLDTGRLVIWDMTCIAATMKGKERLDLYRKVIFASASIPVLTPPVEIAGALHVDGGARAQLFFEKALIPAVRSARAARATRAMEPPAPATAPAPPGAAETAPQTAPAPPTPGTARAQHPAGPAGVRVYVIVNGKIGVADTCVSRNLLDVALRSVSLVLDANAVGDLYRVKCALAPGEFRLSYIPDYVATTTGSDEFDPKQMRLLFDTGAEWARGDRWLQDVPEGLDLGRF